MKDDKVPKKHLLSPMFQNKETHLSQDHMLPFELYAVTFPQTCSPFQRNIFIVFYIIDKDDFHQLCRREGGGRQVFGQVGVDAGSRARDWVGATFKTAPTYQDAKQELSFVQDVGELVELPPGDRCQGGGRSEGPRLLRSLGAGESEV